MLWIGQRCVCALFVAAFLIGLDAARGASVMVEACDSRPELAMMTSNQPDSLSLALLDEPTAKTACQPMPASSNLLAKIDSAELAAPITLPLPQPAIAILRLNQSDGPSSLSLLAIGLLFACLLRRKRVW